MWYRVVAVNEDKRPLAGVVVEAIDLTDRTVTTTVTTNRAGEALFTGLTGPHFFRPRVRRTSGEVGGHHFTGHVEVQVVGFNTNCMDYTVDADGGGTHTTIASAVSAAITAAGSSGRRTIWLCGSITEGSIDIGGLGDSATIIITSPDQHRVRITAPTNKDIFTQTSTGGNVGGQLILKRIGLNPDGANNKAVYDVNATNEVKSILFEDCDFGGSGYLLRQDGTDSLGAITLRVENCSGTLAGFFLVSGASATLAPDQVEALNNRLTLTRWWHFLGGVNADPNFVRVVGGYYSVTNGLTLADGDQFHWSSLVIHYAGSTPAFATGASSTNIKDVTFSDIVIRFLHGDGTFGNFLTAAINFNDGLFIKNIYGFPHSSINAGSTFLTVDTDYLNVHVGNFIGKGFTNQYSGPASGGYTGDHGSLGGLSDDDHTQYLLLAGRGGQTVTDTVTIVGQLRIDDANFNLDIVAAAPRITVDSGDYIEYTRATDTFLFRAGATTYLNLSPLSADFATQITIAGDSNFAFQITGGNPLITMDVGDSLTFDRAGNTWRWNIAGNTIFSASTAFCDFGGAAISVASRFNAMDATDGAQIWWMTGGNADQWIWKVLGPSKKISLQEGGATSRLEILYGGQLRLPTIGSAAGLEIGGDALLYRSAANQLSLGDGDELRLKDRRILIDNGVSGTAHFDIFQAGDSQPRFQIRSEAAAAGASLRWGPGGAVATDIALYRNAANILQLDTGDSFMIPGSLFLQTDQGVAIASAESALRMIHWNDIALIIDQDNNSANDVFRVMHNAATIAGATDLFTVSESGVVHAFGEVEIDGDLNHDGSKIGFFAVAPVARAGAYTQTFATADKTHAVDGSSDMPAGGVGTAAGGWDTAANRDQAIAEFAALRATVGDLKQLVNAVIDDLQAYGLLQ